jgi:hypothetical protein
MVLEYRPKVFWMGERGPGDDRVPAWGTGVEGALPGSDPAGYWALESRPGSLAPSSAWGRTDRGKAGRERWLGLLAETRPGGGALGAGGAGPGPQRGREEETGRRPSPEEDAAQPGRGAAWPGWGDAGPAGE